MTTEIHADTRSTGETDTETGTETGTETESVGAVFDDLDWRGLVQDSTNRRVLGRALDEECITVYAGYDPTADSLHVGNLLIVVLLRRLQLAGHQVIALAGGGTGLIGDPSGKSNERVLNEHAVTSSWASAINEQLERMLGADDETLPTIHVNNLDWIEPLSAIDLLRDLGKHFTISSMLSKDSVRSRLGGEADGLSYTEFSYQILQSFDFLWLNENLGCTMQVGGSDQWGNITAGLDLIRRKGLGFGYGLTTPLIMRSDGHKFGKSEDGAIWLDATKTSPYALFQYFLNVPDADVSRMLRMLTLLDREEIERLERLAVDRPKDRDAQRALASAVVTFVHGTAALDEAKRVSALVFAGTLHELNEAEVARAMAGAPVTVLTVAEARDWESVFVTAGVCASRAAARRLINQGGLYVDQERVTSTVDPREVLGDGAWRVLRKGRRTRVVVRLTQTSKSEGDFSEEVSNRELI